MYASSLSTTVWSSRLTAPLRELERRVRALTHTARSLAPELAAHADALEARAGVLDHIAARCDLLHEAGCERLVPLRLVDDVDAATRIQERRHRAFYRAAQPGNDTRERVALLDETVDAVDRLAGSVGEQLAAEAA